MTQPIPVDVDLTDGVPVTADLSGLELQEGKSYEVTLNIDGKGNQTASVKEIIQGPEEPDESALMAVRHDLSSRAFLIQKTGDFGNKEWQVGYTRFGDWQGVLTAFPADRWTYYITVEAA